MQCVILAAGEGTRMRPLTETMPKPLILVCGMPMIERIVRALPSEIDGLVIVTGYKGEMIREYCGEVFCGLPVKYATQTNPKAGTADALLCAKDLAGSRFLVMYADDLHGKEALAEVVKHDAAMLAARSETPENFGVVVTRADGTLESIIEKPKVPPSNLVNIGGFVLTSEIFEIEVGLSALGEFFLTDSVTEYARRHAVTVVEQSLWIPVGYPDDIEKAEKLLCPR